MRRLVIIIALLVIVPIIEIAVLIAVGQQIGLALDAPAHARHVGARRAGCCGMRAAAPGARFRPTSPRASRPGITATDGLLVLIGGIFMLVPGFVSDIVGLLLHRAADAAHRPGVVLRTFTGRISSSPATSLFGPRRVRVRYGRTQPTPHGQPRRTAGPGAESGAGHRGRDHRPTPLEPARFRGRCWAIAA